LKREIDVAGPSPPEAAVPVPAKVSINHPVTEGAIVGIPVDGLADGNDGDCDEGSIDGLHVINMDGNSEGVIVEAFVDCCVGSIEETHVGDADGIRDGVSDGSIDGTTVGAPVGLTLGIAVGVMVGSALGLSVGVADSAAVGINVGGTDG
jgi:hypothetical protein